MSTITTSIPAGQLRTMIRSLEASEYLARDEVKYNDRVVRDNCHPGGAQCDDCRTAAWAAQEAAGRAVEYLGARQVLEGALNHHEGQQLTHAFRGMIGKDDECRECRGRVKATCHQEVPSK